MARPRLKRGTGERPPHPCPSSPPPPRPTQVIARLDAFLALLEGEVRAHSAAMDSEAADGDRTGTPLKVLVVSHGGVIFKLLRDLCGADVFEIVRNCSITVVTVRFAGGGERSCQCARMGDHSHLPQDLLL